MAEQLIKPGKSSYHNFCNFIQQQLKADDFQIPANRQCMKAIWKFIARTKIILSADGDSVIKWDHAVNSLIKLSSIKQYANDVFHY